MRSLPGTGQAGLVHRMELPPTAETVAVARNGTRESLQSCGLSHLAENAVLLVSELVTNAVRHARGDGSPLELLVIQSGTVLRIEILDTDPRPPTPRTPGALDGSGFGFVLVQAIADDWGVSQTSTGKAVWIEFRTGPETRREEPRQWSGTRVSSTAC
jgi:anti-sigma regulatory factor (Ser/Thr protein kinase)